jgi:protein subunit release factor A
MEAVIVEVGAGEGGQDARLLVREQFSVYGAMGARRGL